MIVTRDSVTGYGLTLSGDYPVFVQTVKTGGAADRAGVKENDLIIKVNGQPVVTDASHSEVVAMIQGNTGRYTNTSSFCCGSIFICNWLLIM